MNYSASLTLEMENNKDPFLTTWNRFPDKNSTSEELAWIQTATQCPERALRYFHITKPPSEALWSLPLLWTDVCSPQSNQVESKSMCTANKLKVGTHTKRAYIIPLVSVFTLHPWGYPCWGCRFNTIRSFNEAHLKPHWLTVSTQKWTGKILNFFPEARHPQIPVAKSQKQVSASRVAGFVPTGLQSPRPGESPRQPRRERERDRFSG